jgi:hypothetical protein
MDTAYARIYKAGTGCDVTSSLIFNLPAPCVPQPCSATLGSGQINGTVWNDPNYDGIRDTAETVGVKDVWVKIYACNASGVSVLVDSVQTDANGNFSKTGLTDGTKYRLEYTNLPTGATSTFTSANSPTTVQFLTAPSCATLGVAWSSQYCQDNPLLVTSCYVGGNQLTGLNNTLDVLVAFPYSASGTPMNGSQTPAPTHLARANQMGSTFGLAYQRKTKTLFTASYFKY